MKFKKTFNQICSRIGFSSSGSLLCQLQAFGRLVLTNIVKTVQTIYSKYDVMTFDNFYNCDIGSYLFWGLVLTPGLKSLRLHQIWDLKIYLEINNVVER